MSESSSFRITACDRLLAQRIRYGEEQSATTLQPFFPKRVPYPNRPPGPEQRTVRSGYVIAAQAGNQRHAQRPRQRQDEQAVSSEMGVDQRRPRRAQLRLDASAPPAQMKRQPLTVPFVTIASRSRGTTSPLRSSPYNQRSPSSQRRRLVLDEALRMR